MTQGRQLVVPPVHRTLGLTALAARHRVVASCDHLLPRRAHSSFKRPSRADPTKLINEPSFSRLAGPGIHGQTGLARSNIGSDTMHGDRRVYSVPRFQPGIDPFIGHPSRNGKMPVYRAPCICSPIHRDTTTSMTRGLSAKPPHPSFFGTAQRRTSSRYQSEGPQCRYPRIVHETDGTGSVSADSSYRVL